MSDHSTLDKYGEILEELRACNICPRKCNANRFDGKKGYCKSGTEFSISSICIHRGEEPVISGSKGICNVFFTNCNLQCVYCQNWQISDNYRSHSEEFLELEEVLRQIIIILDTGINMLGFVSPGHFIPQMKIIVKALSDRGYHPTVVYNSNGYDDVEQLKKLEGMIDVYLPDFKYMDEPLAMRYSDVPAYPQIALKALKEMLRQTGSNVIVDNEGYAMRGLLIRHLVLPGHTENSLNVMEAIATELSPNIHVALMSQYYPCHHASEFDPLMDHVNPAEYARVVDRMKELGITRGFIQGIESADHYRPDFDEDHPFE
jgi:putative pyruvate formate lyase activating enzyme